MHKNTLYITFDGLSDPLGQSQILPYLTGIARHFSITILSCEKKERLDAEKENILSAIGELPITWNYILYDADAGTLSRLQYIRRIRKMADAVCRSKTVRLVHCRSYLAALIGLWLKQKYGVPFLFDMRGFWADERIDGGIWKKSNPLQRLFYTYFKKKENQFIRQSDAIVSLTHAAVRELGKTYPTDLLYKKTTVIPCCTDTDLFSTEHVHTPARLPDISPNDHLLIYTGSIGTWYYTRELLDCALIWKEQIPNLKLLILTKDLIELNAILDTYRPAQRAFILCASSSHKEVAAYLKLAKAAIFFIKPAYSKIASSPTKMAECWSMGLPIITNSGIGDNDLYFHGHQGGILLNDFTSASYLAACRDYLRLSPDASFYRNIALEHFDTRMARERYTAIYNTLTA